MGIKITVIGAQPPSPTAEAHGGFRPTTWAPTPPAPTKTFQASSLPGQSRLAPEVSLDELFQRFPGRDIVVLEALQTLLRHLPAKLDASVVLSFGQAEQERLSDLIQRRLQYSQAIVGQATVLHLNRLGEIFTQLTEGFEGGLFHKSAAAIWAEHRDEVITLDNVLRQNEKPLIAQIQAYGALVTTLQQCGQGLEAALLASDLIAERLPSELGDLLLSRQTSLSASKALWVDLERLVEQDRQSTQELTVLINDAILVQLPSVYTSLAMLSGKPNATQRTIVSESVRSFLHTLHRSAS